MPELPVKDVRLPELHLPELKREDIMRTLSEIPRPDVDLSKIELPKVDKAASDLGKAVANAASSSNIPGLRRQSGPPRWPIAVGGLIVTGLIAWAVLTNEAMRSRVSDAANAVRQRIATLRSGDQDQLEIDADQPIAFDAAPTAPMETAPYADSTVDATGYPEGLGSNNGDGIPAFEESGTRD